MNQNIIINTIIHVPSLVICMQGTE